MRISLFLFTLATIATIAGCANVNSVYREFDVNDGKGAMIDIKQRAIIAAKVPATVVSDSHQTKITSRTIVCAEPSPDALSAYAAELAAEADVPGEVTARLASAFQESSSFVGLRTQSIQLLRDSLYRLCEGYMSGALDAAQYDILMRRYQKYMVALLGIEQLTGAIRVPPVTINTQGMAEAAHSISQMRAEMEAIDAEIKTLEADKGKDGVTDEQKAALDKKIAILTDDRDAIKAGIKNARGLVASGSATATVNVSGMPTQRSEQHLQAVSSVVEKIVIDIINTDDTGQLCFSYLSNDASTNTALKTACENYLANLNSENAARIRSIEVLLDRVARSGHMSDEELRVLTELLAERSGGSGFNMRALEPFSPEQ